MSPRVWAQRLRRAGWLVLALVGAFLAALVATGLAAFGLALAFGPDDPRPELWGGIVFYAAFFGLLSWGIVRDGQRARQSQAGGPAC